MDSGMYSHFGFNVDIKQVHVYPFRGAIVFNYQHDSHAILDVLRILEKDVGGTDLLWALNDKKKRKLAFPP